MKQFDRLLLLLPLLFLITAAVLDGKLLQCSESKQYLVDANRIEQEIMQGKRPSAAQFPSVTDIAAYDGSAHFFRAEGTYLIREINGTFYRIDYDAEDSGDTLKTVLAADAALLVLLCITMAVLIYIRQNILRQFIRLSDVPVQLAKGNLTEPLKEQKNRYFGRFIWGLNMLQSELERTKAQELEHARKEKTLLLSLSHDIKTPLSAIKLYAKGVAHGLYTDAEARSGAAEHICEKTDEIEQYLNEIIEKLHSDFMHFDVRHTEFYLSEVMRQITGYYTDKLSVSGTDFQTAQFTDCMLSGDPDRLAEVLQNILENAIKYGDGIRISVSFSDEEDCRLITVANSGCTLPEEETAHIFESFWRGSNAGSQPGSGLGLYICARLMQEMGGDIFAEAKDGDMRITAVVRKSGGLNEEVQ